MTLYAKLTSKWLRRNAITLLLTCTPVFAFAKGEKVSGNSEDGYTAVPSTKIDFSETTIDGKMKAPDGFFLQGRQAQALSQMVKLRSNFRHELRNSRAAVKSTVK